MSGTRACRGMRARRGIMVAVMVTSVTCDGDDDAAASCAERTAHIMRMCVCVCMLRLTHYIVATIAAESPARIIAAVLYPHYTTSQHITQNNQT